MHSGEVFAIDPLLLERDDDASTPKPRQRHFRKRDKVRVKQMPIDEMKELQEGHGGWNPELTGVIIMTNILSKVLIIDGVLKV